MRFLLINSNPAVSRLINLSIEKLGYEIDEFDNDDLELNQKYDVTIVDSDSASDDSIKLFKESNNLGEIIYIGARGCEKPDFADIILHKPFLPTDFVEMVKKLDAKEPEIKDDETQKEDILDDNVTDNSDALELDDLDSLDIPMPNDDNVYGVDKVDKENEVKEIKEESKQEDIIENDDVDLEGVQSEEQEIETIDEAGDTQADVSVSILDSEDIDEVKQLLKEDTTFEEDVKTEETIEEETRDIAQDDFDLELPEDVTEDLEINLEEERNIEPEFEKNEEKNEEIIEDFEDVKNNDTEEDVKTEETIEEETKDIAQDDFDLELPEDVTEDLEINLEEEGLESEVLNEELDEKDLDLHEEIKETQEENAESEPISNKKDKNSIEDLNEDDFADMFDDLAQPKEDGKTLDLDNIQNDLIQTITKDVKNILNKDEIKDALKSLKVNISISFDEE